MCKSCAEVGVAECGDCEELDGRYVKCINVAGKKSGKTTIDILDARIINAIMFKAARLGLGDRRDSEMFRDLRDGEDKAAFLPALLDEVDEAGRKREEEYGASEYAKGGFCHGMSVELTPWTDSVHCLMDKHGIEHTE